MSVRLYEGNCLDILKTLPDESIHSIVTDPPYGLSFMGRKWDYDVPSVEIWSEALRVLKPGGHLLSFSGTRTYHRMVVAIEDAGFEIRDQIGWLYGSGFPKSHNLDGEWDGWGTAIKPAWEPIVMARKPFKGTVAANVLAHGTGAMNIGRCRITSADAPEGRARLGGGRAFADGESGFKQDVITTSPSGRWPANVIHDGSDEVLAAFPAQSSVTGRRSERSQAAEVQETQWLTTNHKSTEYTDSGSPSRFYYCAKASKSDRCGSKHPTVKPVALMRYLCRLVTPPGGMILDPFAGSGTTGQAAIEEGFDAVLIEREAEYCADIRHRLALPIPAPECGRRLPAHQSISWPDPATPSPQSPPGTSPDASPDSC